MSARILVVDDIPANRQLLRAKLEARYHDVVEANDGRHALDILRTYQPDIILLDVMMPGLDGYETCRKIKENPVTSFIPVVMVTAMSDRAERLKGLQAGAEDFLTKPVDDLALFTRIGALMRYNSVATELRERQATGERAGYVPDINPQSLDKPANIVLVDANELSAARLARILERGKHSLLNPFSESFPDNALGGADAIILSAIKQPFDALRMCSKFRMTPDYRSISIIMIAHQGDSALARKALELGASDIVFAPIDSQELLARVSTQLRRKRYLDILRQRVDRGLELAVIDPLTGLFNRRYFERQLEQALQKARIDDSSFAVAMIDIDHFKQVNDTYGHDTGDQVLSQFGAWLKKRVRNIDTVCRLGGEEFTIIMPNTSQETAFQVADRLRRQIADTPFCTDGVREPVSITISAGIAGSRSVDGAAEEVISEADAALYRAKMEGRNRVITEAA